GAQGGRRTRLDRACRGRHRDRHDGGAAGQAVRGIHPGRCHDCTAFRGHGTRPCHHPQARAPDGRRRDGDERTRQRFGLYGAPAGRREHIKITCRADEVVQGSKARGRFRMKLPRRQFLHPAAGADALPAVSRIASAQAYPSRPITIVAPFPAGGATDIVSRTLAEGMKAPLGQTILVENVTGASGTIGSGRVVRAEPDGYTLVIGQWSSHVGAGALYRLPYHVLHDFEPISVLTTSPLWILGKNDLPAKDLKELIAWLKANPDKASVATVGAGSASHLCMVYFQDAT